MVVGVAFIRQNHAFELVVTFQREVQNRTSVQCACQADPTGYRSRGIANSDCVGLRLVAWLWEDGLASVRDGSKLDTCQTKACSDYLEST